eukprot:3810583-Amphidinium_carterae.1
MASDVQSVVGDGPLQDPLRGWRVGGCIASWSNSLKIAEAMCIYECRQVQDGTKVFVMQKEWRCIKRAVRDRFAPRIAIDYRTAAVEQSLIANAL